MNILGFKCKNCVGYQLEAALLRTELEEARSEIVRLNEIIKASPVSANKETSFKVHAGGEIASADYKSKDKSVDRECLRLEDIERQTDNASPEKTDDREATPTINSPKSPERDALTNIKSRRKTCSQKVVNIAIRAIVEKKEEVFREIILKGTSDWALGVIGADDRSRLISLIEANAYSVAKLSGFNGAAKAFGPILSVDNRAWERMVGFHLPKILNQMEKVQSNKAVLLERWDDYRPKLLEILNKNKPQLLSNLRKSYQIDEYSNIKKDDRDREIHRFLTSVKLINRSNSIGIERVRGYIKAWAAKEINRTSIQTPLPDNGIDFEYWVADRLKDYGWETQVTQGSGDQGVDVVANQAGIRIAVQCKLYQGSVGNKSVQETLAGMSFFDLDRGVVVSTGKYTRSACELAAKNKILLLAPEDIPYMLRLLMG
jgi:restriction system protein